VGYLKSGVKQMRQIKDLAKQKWQFEFTKKNGIIKYSFIRYSL